MTNVKVLVAQVAELEASLQSTENYWKSKYELEVDKVAELERRLSDETAWEEYEKMLTDAATAKIKKLQDEIVELKEEMGELESKTEDFEYDLQSLQSDLKQLDSLMDDLHGISEYDDLADMLTEIQSFLKVCDRNSDGHYEHYETRQIATRVEGGVYQSLKS